MADFIRRSTTFLISGAVTTAVAYAAFMLLLPLTHFLVAASVSWALSVVCGFALNRRFTFGIEGKAHRARDFGSFVTGAVLQYFIAMAGYWLLLVQLKMNPTAAFVLNLAATTTFSFSFLNLVTFRRALRAD